jgi:hypothetical protein
MNPAATPHPDNDSLQQVLNSVAQWITRYREARRAQSQLKNCSAVEVEAMARELKMSPSELMALSKKGPNSADQLQKLLIALGVDPQVLSYTDPAIVRDLQRVCTTCGHKRQCDLDLVSGKLTEKFHDYCPNAFTLDALLEARQ